MRGATFYRKDSASTRLAGSFARSRRGEDSCLAELATIAVINSPIIRVRITLSDLRCAFWWVLLGYDLWVIPLHAACLTQLCESVERMSVVPWNEARGTSYM